MKNLILVIFLFFCFQKSWANDSLTAQKTKKDTYIMHGIVLGSFMGTLGILNEYWYKDYPKSSFHFFNDSKEWLDADKTGHLVNSYFISAYASEMYKAIGNSNKHSAIYGYAAGSLFMMTIEILDGFSEKWGASVPDLIANTAGGGLFLAQELIWQEQRAVFKISTLPRKHAPDLTMRADQLYGTSFIEKSLKDYNGVTSWISINPSSFSQNDWSKLSWLNIAFGYGVQGIYGGFQNKWCSDPNNEIGDCPPNMLIDRSDITRFRQFYISPDIDLSRIPVKRKSLKLLLKALNSFKFPMPTIEINTLNQVNFHWLYF